MGGLPVRGEDGAMQGVDVVLRVEPFRRCAKALAEWCASRTEQNHFDGGDGIVGVVDGVGDEVKASALTSAPLPIAKTAMGEGRPSLS